MSCLETNTNRSWKGKTNTAMDVHCTADATLAADAYSAAKELAESYDDLLKQKELYRREMGSFPHYTLADAYYLLTQGAHAQSERVQTNTISDPTAKAVGKAEKLMRRLNREMDREYQAKVVDPYLDVCEKVALFEICMDRLTERQHHIADQLYVQRKPKNSIVDQRGIRIPRNRLETETEAILASFAVVLERYKSHRSAGGFRIIAEREQHKTDELGQ